MRRLLLACSLIFLAAPASAACRCACVEGQMKPICQSTDLVHPICTGLCMTDVRPATVTQPIAGGQPQYDVVQPFEMNPQERKERAAAANALTGRVQGSDENYDTDTRGYQLGTAGILGGNSAFSVVPAPGR